MLKWKKKSNLIFAAFSSLDSHSSVQPPPFASHRALPPFVRVFLRKLKHQYLINPITKL
jgi:hypothetical protein